MIYILSNANAVSGGPELLHQLCHKLVNRGVQAAMLYYNKFIFPAKKPGQNIVNNYSKYSFTNATKIAKAPDNIFILPETMPFFIPRLAKKGLVVMWWMSVDNYFKSLDYIWGKYYSFNRLKSEKYNPFTNNKIVHAVQSRYAYDFLVKKGVPENRIFYLSDYISDEFFKKSSNEESYEKHDTVLYNPKKGYEFTMKLKNNSNFNWVPLENMSHDEMIEKMCSSKVYIDFGNHPGKDRIPREAATCGCLIVTGTKGAAANDYDVCIPRKYKFDDKDENISKIVAQIQDLLENYSNYRKDYDLYRKRILSEEDTFEKEIDSMCERFGLIPNNK